MSPLAALRFCTYPGCNVRVASGRCPTHRADQECYRLNITVRRWYRSARWQAIRTQHYDANPLCVECERAGVVRVWTELDHIRPHQGNPALFWDARNLQGLCATHHRQKTARRE